jgi:hypothetical protein
MRPPRGNRAEYDRSASHTARTSGYTAFSPPDLRSEAPTSMTQHSEERLPETEGAPSVRAGARILPFERPQSELQRAIQQRAQDALDRDRELDREKRRPQPLKWLAIFALACIPVLLTIGAVDGFLRVFHKVAAMYSTATPTQEQQPAQSEDVQSQPGVVMLQSYDTPSDAPASDASPPQPADTPTTR